MRRIFVDLTPVLPGGANGGAKIMSLELVKQMALLTPNDRYILIASKDNANELAQINLPNIEIQCLTTQLTLTNCILAAYIISASPFLKLSDKLLPHNISVRLRKLYIKCRDWLKAKKLQNLIKGDLLFCPFTAPFYRSRNMPIVSVIYDLQSHYYPYFFTTDDCIERKRHFKNACKWATKLVCISDFVKVTVIDTAQIAENKIKTVHIRLAHRLSHIHTTEILDKLNLTANQYLLYPANFWAHKNHQMLFTAFGLYRKNYPQSPLKLVCTGSDNAMKTQLQETLKTMQLENSVIMPGYLSNDEFACLMQNCRALIFPSLYEGFGMPLLEGMAHNKPVLCSNLTSMPEVAGDAALLFDPRKPTEMADAIHRIESDADLVNDLIARGKKRIEAFGTPMDMAKEYLSVFNELCVPTHE